MKKAAKKAAKAKPQAKAAPKSKAKSPVKAAKKTKAAPKKKVPALKAKAVAKKTAAKPKVVAKAKAPVKKAAPPKTKKLARMDLPKGTTGIEVRQDKSRIVITPVPAPSSAPALSSSGPGTPESPWLLKTPAGFSEFQAYRDENSTPPALVVKVGSTELRYDLRCINDLHEMLKAHGDWKLLGSADEQQPVVEDTVEAWARSPANPIGGFYGLKPGLRGRFATYVPQVLEAMGLAEVEHFPNNNRMRAK